MRGWVGTLAVAFRALDVEVECQEPWTLAVAFRPRLPQIAPLVFLVIIVEAGVDGWMGGDPCGRLLYHSYAGGT